MLKPLAGKTALDPKVFSSQVRVPAIHTELSQERVKQYLNVTSNAGVKKNLIRTYSNLNFQEKINSGKPLVSPTMTVTRSSVRTHHRKVRFYMILQPEIKSMVFILLDTMQERCPIYLLCVGFSC